MRVSVDLIQCSDEMLEAIAHVAAREEEQKKLLAIVRDRKENKRLYTQGRQNDDSASSE